MVVQRFEEGIGLPQNYAMDHMTVRKIHTKELDTKKKETEFYVRVTLTRSPLPRLDSQH